jgi:hypothetical protein
MAKKKNKKFQIIGRVIDSNTGKGIPGLRVEAWDKDLIFDDFIGKTITDKQGKFVIEFTESHFKDIFLDRRPDLFFKIYENKKLIKSTEDSILWNVSSKVKNIGDIKVKSQSPAKIDLTIMKPTILKLSVLDILKKGGEEEEKLNIKLNEILKKRLLAPLKGKPDSGLIPLIQELENLNIAEINELTLSEILEKYIKDELSKDEELIEDYKKLISSTDSGKKIKSLLELEIPFERNSVFAEESHASKIYELGRIADLNMKDINRLVEKQFEFVDVLDSTWNKMVDDGIIPKNKLPDIKLTCKLSDLTGENFKLIEVLKTNKIPQLDNKPVSDIKDLIALDKNEWLTFFQENGIEAPQNITLEKYAEQISANIERTYPSEFLFYRIVIKDKTTEMSHIEKVQKLFDKNEILFTGSGVANINWKGIASADKAVIKNALLELNKFGNTYKNLGITEILNDKNLSLSKKKTAVGEKIGKIKTFYDNNSNFDLRFADFIGSIYWSDNSSEQPVSFVWDDIEAEDQPLVRNQLMLYQRMFRISLNYETFSRLVGAGYDSAYAVTCDSKETFLRNTGISTYESDKIYQNAQTLEMQVAHSVSQLYDMVEGTFGNLNVGNIDPKFLNDIKKIDGYEELFGSQNYCACQHCQSILSPAAYFVDLMYFIQEKVIKTEFEGHGDSPIHLKNRRPDLWQLQLSCKNTYNLISYLEIINETLANYIYKITSVDAYRLLSTADNSFNLPFNLPLSELRTYLGHFQLNLATIFKIFGIDKEKISREKLNISKEEFDIIKQQNLSTIEKKYGNPESTNEMDVQYFLKYTGITREELDIIIKFKFLNEGVNGDNISIIKEQDPEEIQNFAEKIINLNKTRLDRIHRFIRLWRKLPWSLEEFNLVLGSLFDSGNTNTLNAHAVRYISALKSIQDTLGISVEELCGLWYLIPKKPIHDRESLFDRLFKSLFSNGNEPVIFYHHYFDGNPSDPERIDENTPVLIAGLAVSESDLLNLLIYLKEDLGINNEGEFVLSWENLSLLYRHAKLAKALKIPVENSLYLISMALKLPEKLNTIENILKVIEFTEWLQKTPLTTTWLWKVLNEDKQVKSLIKKIQTDEVLVLKDTELMVIEGVSEIDSKKIILKLTEEEYLTRWISNDTFKLTNNYRIDLELEDVLKDIDISESAKEKMDEIRDVLNSFHPVTLLPDYLIESLNTNSEGFQLMIMLFNIDLSDSIYIDALSSALDDDNQRGIKILNTLFAFQSLYEKLELKEPSLRFISEHPEIFRIDSDVLDIENVKLIADYRRLLNIKEDSEANVHQILTGYSPMIDFTDEAHESLAYVLETEKELILSVIDTLKINDEHLSKNPIENVFHIIRCLKICNTLGVNARSLYQLTKTEFDELLRGRDTVYGAFRARYENEEEWGKISEPFTNELNSLKRDAMTDYILKSSFGFEGANDIYQYFLIDTEMEGCAKTSPVKAGISSLQLYVHRCLMNLEQSKLEDGVKVSPGCIPEDEWAWRKNYRVWEANRKVFLYPENWIEPELRDNKTPIFEDLEEELLQQEITLEAAENTYKTYMASFMGVANLKISGSYHDEGTNTLFLFGRTTDDPPQYFYRKCINETIWTPWLKVDLAINANKVSPILYNNKLYIFWIEVRTKHKNEIRGGSSSFLGYVHKIFLNYSSLGVNGKWSMPNKVEMKDIEDRLAEDDEFIVINPYPNYPSYQIKIPKLDAFIPKYDEERRIHVEAVEDYTLVGYQWEKLYPHLKDGEIYFYYCSGRLDNDNSYVMHYNDFYNHLDFYEKKIKESTLSDEEIAAIILLEELWNSKNVRTLIPILAENEFSLFSYTFLCLPSYLCFDPTYHINSPMELQLNDNNKIGTCEKSPYVHAVTGKLSNYILETEHESFLIKKISEDGFLFSALKVGTSVADKLARKLYESGLSKLLSINTQKTEEDNFPVTSGKIKVTWDNIDYNYLKGACGDYYRELFFHIPFTIANHLNSIQKFEEAQKWYHYIFNPTVDEDADPERPTDRNWRYILFRDVTIEKLKDILTDEEAIARYKQDPFNPHAVARMRINAYQKAIVMKYIDNLLDWGDYLFTQDTMESINEATMIYIIAANILGKRPVKLGECQLVSEDKLTYEEIAPNIESGSEFLIEMENYVFSPFYSYEEIAGTLSENSSAKKSTASVQPRTMNYVSSRTNRVISYWESIDTAEIYGNVAELEQADFSVSGPFANGFMRQVNSLVFCVPPNDILLGYWDRVEDRLYKIRNCMNIKGIRRVLPLFQPPIDPGMLVKAKAAGLSFEDVVAALYEGLPPYRFTYLIEKAKMFTATIQSLGSALLNALEKKDVEELALLHSVHEQNILKMTRDIKKKQIGEAKEQIDSLIASKVNIENRVSYYDDLIGEGLIQPEYVQQISIYASSVFQILEAGLRSAGALLYLVPNTGSPFAITYGGRETGKSMEAFSDLARCLSSTSQAIASSAGLKASFERREQEWKFQLKLAKQELEQIDKQITAAEIRLEIAEKDLEIHEKSIAQSKEVYDFYKDKFTKLGLFNWMSTTLHRLHREAYNVAYDMAKMAERTYQFERDDNTVFIQNDNWDVEKSGLLAGERLMLQLQQMDKAYIENNIRDYEVNQSFSLAQLDPQGIINLRESGSYEFEIPEIWFDLFYPGQFKRVIKSVRLTIPCVTGPYTNVSCKLTLIDSAVRKEPKLDIDLTHIPHQKLTSVATSNANNDGGVFELNFRDERYMPFEGAGAISRWKLELPNKLRNFDYDTISDVIIHISYTAKDDGQFREKVESEIENIINQYAADYGLQRFISAKHEFSNEWAKFLNPAGEETAPILELDLSKGQFPYIFRDKEITLNAAHFFLKLKEGFEYDDANPLLFKLKKEEGYESEECQFKKSGSPVTELPYSKLEGIDGSLGKWYLEVANLGIALESIEDILIVFEYSVDLSE